MQVCGYYTDEIVGFIESGEMLFLQSQNCLNRTNPVKTLACLIIHILCLDYLILCSVRTIQ